MTDRLLPDGASRAITGWAPWRLVQDGDTEEASRADQADPGAMAAQGTQEAMKGQGIQEAMTGQGFQVAMVDQGTWETVADPPWP